VEEDRRYKKCPFCGEEILEIAIKCRYCLSNLSENIEDGMTGENSLANDKTEENILRDKSRSSEEGTVLQDGYYELYPKADTGRCLLAFLLDSFIGGLGGIVLIPFILMTLRNGGLLFKPILNLYPTWVFWWKPSLF